MNINATINFNLYLDKERGQEIVFYPFETTRFSCCPIMELDRHDTITLEKELCERTTRKWNPYVRPFGFKGQYETVEGGVEPDNKSTFTINGIAFHFHDWKVWVYPESAMEVGKF